MFLTAFFGFVRVGEITLSKQSTTAIYLSQVSVSAQHLAITITQFKHNLKHQPFQILLMAQDHRDLCPFAAMVEYIQLRGYDQGPLFRFPDGKAITRLFFAREWLHL